MGAAVALLSGAMLLGAVPPTHAQETLRYGRYGPVQVFRPQGPPSRVAVLLSGDGGWSPGVATMARALTDEGALVLGVDMRLARQAMESTPQQCAYPAADLEGLSQYAQKRLDLPRYLPPILVGYSGGASLAYAVLAQAPPNTFAAAVSLGFCPELLLRKPLCRGSGLPSDMERKGRAVRLKPTARPLQPWIVLHGADDQACPLATTAGFVRQVAGARLVSLPDVGHGFSHPARWEPQLRDAVRRLPAVEEAANRPQAEPVRDLPLVEVPAKNVESQAAGRGQDATGRQLAVVISGDGGWASIDRDLGHTLAQHGVPVVGLNSLQYFWSPRTPDGAARDLERILRHYLEAWRADRAVLIGYSRGADVLPFLASRLPDDLRRRVDLVVLLGAEHYATFEFHVTDWFTGSRPSGLPTAPEIGKLRWTRVLCFYGQEERDTVCPDLPRGAAEVVRVPGGHHFGGDYDALARAILARLAG